MKVNRQSRLIGPLGCLPDAPGYLSSMGLKTPSSRGPVVTVAAEHCAAGDLIAPRVSDALGAPS